MDREDLNVMSEFLVMAATLLDIKCKMLLPKEINEEGEEEDPRQELVEQLLQYKMYKYMAFELKDRELDSGQVMYKSPDIPEEILEYAEPVDLDQLLGDLTMAKLGEVFREIMKRQAEKIDPVRSKFGKIEKEEVTCNKKRPNKIWTFFINIYGYVSLVWQLYPVKFCLRWLRVELHLRLIHMKLYRPIRIYLRKPQSRPRLRERMLRF